MQGGDDTVYPERDEPNGDTDQGPDPDKADNRDDSATNGRGKGGGRF